MRRQTNSDRVYADAACSRDAARRLPHPRCAANTAEILKFLIDRTAYIKQLEAEDTPEAFLAGREPS